MKLYYMPGACSLASHIALREAGMNFDTVRVDGKTKKTANGDDYLQVTAKGYVPALLMDNGEVLTEGTAIMQYIADQKPAANLNAPVGSPARYRVAEWMGYINSEIHKGYGPLFNPAATPDQKQAAIEALGKKFTWIQGELGDKPYLLGEQFTIADGYLFTVLGWTSFIGVDLGKWPGLKAYHGRVAARPQVFAALKAEGLVK
jgi:glutathione S-transferase